ncbi:unnamed protein product [Cuscuta epithymum]|uniref:Uncharacterized protein n=1 Tax=Cuscuta epithymum TaxID=186058 RepID=A0AAV0ERT8_9ASTE|nr:unnamed protein product [Cuscuta epithymum]
MERGEGLGNGDDRSAVRPPPEPPPWSDRVAWVWKFYQSFNFSWFYFCVMFYVALFCGDVFSFKSTTMIHNSARYYVDGRIFMANECCVRPIWWLTIRVVLSGVIVSESSRRVD